MYEILNLFSMLAFQFSKSKIKKMISLIQAMPIVVLKTAEDIETDIGI